VPETSTRNELDYAPEPNTVRTTRSDCSQMQLGLAKPPTGSIIRSI
jgi:hypothetical protein